MVCSICNGTGHNRRTCPQRNTTGLINQPTPPHNPPPNRRALTRKLWRTTIQSVLDLKRFVKVSLLLDENRDRKKYAYFHWLKIKDLFDNRVSGDYTFGDCIRDVFGKFNSSYTNYILECTNQACLKFHKEKNSVKDNKRKIKLINMKNENYLIYWVIGNLMIEDIDSRENSINYMGMLRKNDTFGLNTMIGHRFYLVSHRLDIEPPYHPLTDKQFFIEPYLQLNIHEGSKKEIYIDEGEKLSELNRWKFNALKLDYLIRELIKLGAKNNETLDVVLDLHEDIVLDQVSEWYKDIAGIPSTFTNIT
tara:strand:- start:879 stop:1796 length:918 start_codon:yes stop_codon:yes gene_type:complete